MTVDEVARDLLDERRACSSTAICSRGSWLLLQHAKKTPKPSFDPFRSTRMGGLMAASQKSIRK
jgi:hypothetical protein